MKNLRLASNPMEFENNDKSDSPMDMSIRIKNGVAIITGHSASTTTHKETTLAVEQMSGVTQVLNLATVETGCV